MSIVTNELLRGHALPRPGSPTEYLDTTGKPHTSRFGPSRKLWGIPSVRLSLAGEEKSLPTRVTYIAIATDALRGEKEGKKERSPTVYLQDRKNFPFLAHPCPWECYSVLISELFFFLVIHWIFTFKSSTSHYCSVHYAATRGMM